ncbi:FAD-dependent oxidoreductase [Chamaesiphon sp. GL140_3_metabinner_50]|uniref:NAD(P)/FAD-dependent oxidoreductase n=1 Tax=Chamaesiphon sp. GL140_3_metabinner_50 TaxID=2970812 RepID=UPI0025F981BD|nr:FAD-dependent oxidoreductase [Chamaesiphon sp. GL140_3_metabinner_50]
MKIGIVGGGIVGLTTAYYLLKNGHEVAIFEKHGDVSQQASFGNGGQLSYSYIQPFASRAILKQAIESFFTNLPYAIDRATLIKNASWVHSYVRSCNDRSFYQTAERLHELCVLSESGFAEICRDIPNIQIQKNGKVVLYSSAASFNGNDRWMAFLDKNGIETRKIERKKLKNIDPCLDRVEREYHGGLYTPNDAYIDPVDFSKKLLNYLTVKYQSEFKILFNSQSKLLIKNGVTIGISAAAVNYNFDSVVVCAGLEASKMEIGCNIIPIRGYSLTYSIDNRQSGVSITDYSKRCLLSNAGDSIRATAGADFVGLNDRVPPDKWHELENFAKKIHPHVSNIAPTKWVGFRPLTPSSFPIITKAEKTEGLYINSGHGGLGVTLSVGSARYLVNLIGR